jgi:hypothetical protein
MSLTTPAIRASESNHWYTRDGVPQYTVPSKKDGSPRATTLRDARTMNLVPSVTTVLNVAAKPALLAWLQQQVLLAALTLPRRPDEPEKEYIDRIINDSKEQGRSAADAGTDIHASIQGFYENKPTGKHQESVQACDLAIKNTSVNNAGCLSVRLHMTSVLAVSAIYFLAPRRRHRCRHQNQRIHRPRQGRWIR